MNEIAIASVPIQEWEQPLDEREAFCQGSIFRQLHKPFYAEHVIPGDGRLCGCVPETGTVQGASREENRLCGCVPEDRTVQGASREENRLCGCVPESKAVQGADHGGDPVCSCTPADAREAKLLELQQATFFLIDLTLFLDTHPDHAQALQMKQQYQQKRKDLLAQFAAEFYPLTMDCQGEAKEEPLPWGKGGNAHVAL